MCALGFRRTTRRNAGWISCASAETTGASFPPAAIDPAATIAVFHTSGTSGFPKGAALSSNALLGARASTVLAGTLSGPAGPGARRAALVAHHGRQHCALWPDGRHSRLLPRSLRRRNARWTWSSALASPPSSACPPCSPGWSTAIPSLRGSPACACGSRPATTCPPRSASACASTARCCGCPAAGAFRRCC